MRGSFPIVGQLFAGALLLAACSDDTTSGGGGAGASSAQGAGTSSGGASAGGAPNGGAGTGGEGPQPSAACPATALPSPSKDCAAANVRCVGGASSEHASIQEAADATQPGDTVVVAAGSWAGFQIDNSGTAAAPIQFVADGAVTIDSPAPTGDGIRVENASHVRVIGFAIYDTPERCIAARGATPDAPTTDVWVVSNTCDRAGVEGFYLSELAGSHVELNIIRDSGQSGSTRSHGIYLANAGSDDTTLCGNLIAGSAPAESNGIHFNGDLSVGGDGIISGLLVQGNVVTGHAQNGFNLDGVQSSTFVNNLVYGNVRNALRAYAIDAAEGPAGLTIVSNTFVTGPSGGWPVKLTEDLGGHVVFDNVLLSDNPDTGSIALAPSPGFASSHNIVVDRFTNDDESTTIDLAAWQALGFDDGSIVATPAQLFVAPGSDFQLIAGSPAVDAGVASFGGANAPSVDLDGASRPAGAGFDIGAYERP